MLYVNCFHYRVSLIGHNIGSINKNMKTSWAELCQAQAHASFTAKDEINVTARFQLLVLLETTYNNICYTVLISNASHLPWMSLSVHGC